MPKQITTSKQNAQSAFKGGSSAATSKVKKLCARTPAGKAQRWQIYQARRKALNKPAMPYKAWSNLYDVNMEKANKANKAVSAYHKKIGWGKTEVTVKVKKGVRRRLDIADVKKKRGIEHKTGKISASKAIRSEVERDATLVQNGWDIKWYFEGTATKPLVKMLEDSNIGVEFKK